MKICRKKNRIKCVKNLNENRRMGQKSQKKAVEKIEGKNRIKCVLKLRKYLRKGQKSQKKAVGRKLKMKGMAKNEGKNGHKIKKN